MPSEIGFQSNPELNAKKAEDLPSVFGAVNLLSIREQVQEILKLVGRDGIFREYSLHDITHIDALLALVDKLIPGETQKRMRTADWLLIVLSCYFHDLGMLVTKQEYDTRYDGTHFSLFKTELLEGDKGEDYRASLDNLAEAEREEFLYQEFVRQNHAKRIYHWILGQDARQYGNASAAVDAVNVLLSSLEIVVRDDLAKICLSHHEEDLFDFDKYKINRVYGDHQQGEANLHYAALILRSADVLQIQRKRVPPVLYKLIDPSNPRSQEEWAKQAGVRAVKPKPAAAGLEADTIEVHASFDKESAYFGLLAYIQRYAAKELGRCATWATDAQRRGSSFEFPWKYIDTSQIEPRGFEGRTYAFKLDQEKILTLLTGHTLYNDAKVSLREVLQNALDAVRFRHHQYPAEPMGEISIVWDPIARKLIIRDTGTGMTKEIIENFLLNVGASFYQSEFVVQKYGSFSPISRFGIGILSTFMIADEVEILTVHPDDDFARQLTLPSVVRSYLVRKLPKGDQLVQSIGAHGTQVTLKVRRSASLNDVTELVRHWMVIPNCKITCTVAEFPPVEVGFPNVEAAIEYYFDRAPRNSLLAGNREIRSASEGGLQIAYMVATSKFVDVWDFVLDDRSRTEDESADDILDPPGTCIEGVRVRSAPLGFDFRDGAPWALVNLTGRDAPRTNVARSDLEQTPELERATTRIYRALGLHVAAELARLEARGSGVAEAAREADTVLAYGLLGGSLSNQRLLDYAISDLKIIAVEEDLICRTMSRGEFDALADVWTVESKLLTNVAGMCGMLGLNFPASVIVQRLGGSLAPPIPLPRFMGENVRWLQTREVASILTYAEERSVRLDLCWRTRRARCEVVPSKLLDRISGRMRGIQGMLIANEKGMSKMCPDFDVISWRGHLLFLETSPIPDLLRALGMTENLVKWTWRLMRVGEISDEERPLLREQLFAAKYVNADQLLARMTLPRERQFGDRLWQKFWRDNADDDDYAF